MPEKCHAIIRITKRAAFSRRDQRVLITFTKSGYQFARSVRLTIDHSFRDEGKKKRVILRRA